MDNSLSIGSTSESHTGLRLSSLSSKQVQCDSSINDSRKQSDICHDDRNNKRSIQTHFTSSSKAATTVTEVNQAGPLENIITKRKCEILSPVVRFKLKLDSRSFANKTNRQFSLRRSLNTSFRPNWSASPTAVNAHYLSLNVDSSQYYARRGKTGNVKRRNILRILKQTTTKKRLMIKMDKIRVDGANGLRFSARKKGGFTPGTGSPFSGAFVTSASESLLRIPKTDINPNKAVFTIDSKTSNILIVNNNACQLLGYTPGELCDKQFSSLLTNKVGKNYVSALAEGQLNSKDGTMVLLSGKVVEMNKKCATKVAVSLWIRQIDVDGRCLAVAEPVERRIAQMVIDRNGVIVSADADTLWLFQMDAEEELIGTDIQAIIPAIQLPDADSNSISKLVRKQKATGKTQDGLSFPLCLMVTAYEDSGSESVDSGVSSTNLYMITIWVFQNISGLVVIDDTGSIELCNHHFSMLMFGYSQTKMLRMHITRLIPNFGQEFEYLGYSRSRNVTTSSLDDEENEESETETDPVYYEADQSFYATPAGLTTSEYSKSSYSVRNNAELNSTTNYCDESMYMTPKEMTAFEYNIYNTRFPVDMSKARSEPVKICWDAINPSTTNATANDETATDCGKCDKAEAFESLNCQCDSKKSPAMAKSLSENVLVCGENDQNAANRRYSQIEGTSACFKTAQTFTDAVCADKEQHKNEKEKADAINNCDGTELLTPVNETDISNEYLLASDRSLNKTQMHRPNNNATSTSTDGSQMYRTTDISDALRGIGNDTSQDISMIRLANNTTPKERNTPNATQSNQAPITSTPGCPRFSDFMPSNASVPSVQQVQYNDGKYKGEAIHCDGNVINVLYTISSQELPCGRKVYCVWICRDVIVYDEEEEDEDDGKHPNLTLTFNSINSTVETSASGQAAKRNSVNASAACGISAVSSAGVIGVNTSSRPNSVSLLSQCEDEQICGEYSKHYTTLKQIGKGAFGYVKMAFRHSDRLLVVTKFILKEKLPTQFMVITEDKKEIPMEVYLLSTVKHPNIVSVLDVFENEKFFQFVMEKHGSGMDLFEFIDRRPMIDEQLGCYIFRQIVDAVDYLHSLKILHRDIKDENIIIDQYFHVKLIDFGSATFMEDGKLFSTFYGTTEYCSPEVLAGNKYAGPELEIWSLGVTLFVLIFFENPFLDIEETLRAELLMPHPVSPELEHILCALLDKNPKTRCTMKELISDPWIMQEINSLNFNFSWIVPCENHESNPDKYFTGQVYSSATGLSITSPHDSLSLADEEDSMIGADEDIEDEELDEEGGGLHSKHEFDYQKTRKSNEICNLKESDKHSSELLSESTSVHPSSTTIISVSTNSGKKIVHGLSNAVGQLELNESVNQGANIPTTTRSKIINSAATEYCTNDQSFTFSSKILKLDSVMDGNQTHDKNLSTVDDDLYVDDFESDNDDATAVDDDNDELTNTNNDGLRASD